MDNSIVVMKKIRKSFGGKTALDGADLDLMKGEVLGLVGDNGAGKSTILKTLAGVFPRYGGEIFVEGERARVNSPRQARSLGIEMVYQDLSMCGSLSVWENIFLGRYETYPGKKTFIPVLNKRLMSQLARQKLQAMGIDLANMNQPVKTLSGGEQQAVALCRCLLFEPKVILLDEPTASMAVWEQKKVLDMIRRLKSDGRSIVMVTHNLHELFAVADRALVLKEGRNIWCGPIQGMNPDDLVQMMFLGKA